MAFLECSFYSCELGMDTQVQIILPEARAGHRILSDKKYRLLYCLHGHSRDHSTFSRYGILEHLLGNSDVIAVIPNAHRSFYMDERQGYRYFTYLTEELPVILSNYFPVSRNSEDHYLCGFSMGGYGALRTILKYPKRYAGAAIFSVASEPFECMDILDDVFPGMVPDLCSNIERIFGPRSEFSQTDGNLELLIKKTAEHGVFPLVYHACGKQDVLYDMNQRLRQQMEDVFPQAQYIYREEDGIHDWNFWNTQLRQMAEIFHFV